MCSSFESSILMDFHRIPMGFSGIPLQNLYYALLCCYGIVILICLNFGELYPITGTNTSAKRFREDF